MSERKYSVEMPKFSNLVLVTVEMAGSDFSGHPIAHQGIENVYRECEVLALRDQMQDRIDELERSLAAEKSYKDFLLQETSRTLAVVDPEEKSVGGDAHIVIRQYLRKMKEELASFRIDLYETRNVVTPENFAEMQQRAEEAEAELTAERRKMAKLKQTFLIARPIAEWHEDMGFAVWWRFPVDEPPYVGCPNCCNWPGYHTHFVQLTNELIPRPASALIEPGEGRVK